MAVVKLCESKIVRQLILRLKSESAACLASLFFWELTICTTSSPRDFTEADSLILRLSYMCDQTMICLQFQEQAVFIFTLNCVVVSFHLYSFRNSVANDDNCKLSRERTFLYQFSQVHYNESYIQLSKIITSRNFLVSAGLSLGKKFPGKILLAR